MSDEPNQVEPGTCSPPEEREQQLPAALAGAQETQRGNFQKEATACLGKEGTKQALNLA